MTRAAREHTVKVRMTKAELREAERKAKAEGLTLAAYLRRLANRDELTEAKRRGDELAASLAVDLPEDDVEAMVDALDRARSR